jgi:two-component system chemotaxis response regulator CheB
MTTSPNRLIVIGGSAGSFQTVVKLLSVLPKDYPFPILLCLHRMRSVRHGFSDALSIKSNKKVIEPYDKQTIDNECIFLAPANYHLLVDPQGTLSLSTEELINNSRPAIDLLFESAAQSYRRNLLAILLSGANRDGAKGLQAVKKYKGTCIVQDPEESLISTMPSAALQTTEVDYTLDSDKIVEFVLNLAKH